MIINRTQLDLTVIPLGLIDKYRQQIGQILDLEYMWSPEYWGGGNHIDVSNPELLLGLARRIAMEANYLFDAIYVLTREEKNENN